MYHKNVTIFHLLKENVKQKVVSEGNMIIKDKVEDSIEGNNQIIIEQQYEVIEIEEVEYERKEDGYVLKYIDDNEVAKNEQQF